MPIIEVAVKDKIAEQTNGQEYICGNSDFTVAFSFDAEWDEFSTKTARFIYGDSYQDVVFNGNQCPVPVISNTNTILCGVFAGNLQTTTPASIMARKSILCGSGSPASPSPDVYAQIMEVVNETQEIAQSVHTEEYKQQIVQDVIAALPVYDGEVERQ